MPHANGGLSSKHLSFPTARCLALGQCHTAIGGVRGRARHHKLREDEDEAEEESDSEPTGRDGDLDAQGNILFTPRR